MGRKGTKKTNGRATRAGMAKKPAKGKALARVGASVVMGKPGAYSPHMDIGQTIAMRDLFWSNVVREMLNGMSVLCQQQPELFDGRFGVLTRDGERIPIGHVTPLFACSIPTAQEDRDASVAVQCTVFQLTTPEGEVFTLPVHEIRGLHTMTQELLEKLQKLAEEEEGDEENGEPRPFGLAAFAALPKPQPPAGPGMAEGLGE
jgi:hypothetical protein